MKYKIIEAETAPDLEKQVKTHLDLAWTLCGGLQVIRYEVEKEEFSAVGPHKHKLVKWAWFQAMVTF